MGDGVEGAGQGAEAGQRAAAGIEGGHRSAVLADEQEVGAHEGAPRPGEVASQVDAEPWDELRVDVGVSTFFSGEVHVGVQRPGTPLSEHPDAAPGFIGHHGGDAVQARVFGESAVVEAPPLGHVAVGVELVARAGPVLGEAVGVEEARGRVRPALLVLLACGHPDAPAGVAVEGVETPDPVCIWLGHEGVTVDGIFHQGNRAAAREVGGAESGLGLGGQGLDSDLRRDGSGPE